MSFCLFVIVFTLCLIITITLKAFDIQQLDSAFVKDIFSIGATLFVGLLGIALYTDWIEQKEYDKIDILYETIINFESEIKYIYKYLKVIENRYLDQNNSEIICIGNKVIDQDAISQFSRKFQRNIKVLNAYSTDEKLIQAYKNYHSAAADIIPNIALSLSAYLMAIREIQEQTLDNTVILIKTSGEDYLLRSVDREIYSDFISEFSLNKKVNEEKLSKLYDQSYFLRSYLNFLKGIQCTIDENLELERKIFIR